MHLGELWEWNPIMGAGPPKGDKEPRAQYSHPLRTWREETVCTPEASTPQDTKAAGA